MAHIVCITGGLTGIFNASLALVEQRVQAGHRVTYASPADWRAAVEAESFETKKIEYVQLDEWVIQFAEPPMSRWEKLKKMRSRQQSAVAALGVQNFVSTMRSLSPDLILIDIEMHPHIMAAVSAGLPVASLCQFLSVWHRPNLPPTHTGTIPGVGWRGHRLGIELSWLQYSWQKWKTAQRERWQRMGVDRISVLRCYAKQLKHPFCEQFGFSQWLVPYPHRNLPVLCLNASELDFPHSLHPCMKYVGAMVKENRKAVQLSPIVRAEVEQLLKKRQPGRPLIYCGCSTFIKGNKRFLLQLIKAVEQQPDWDLVLGLGGQLDPGELGELPGNVRVFDWVPQMMLLQQASCAINNGGINSINECLHLGVPMLVYSLKRYDQNGNAARVSYHGLGIAGDFEQDSAGQIRQHLQRLLSEERYRQAAENMRDRYHQYHREQRAVRCVEELLKSARLQDNKHQEASQHVSA